jgi:hypothetical protein
VTENDESFLRITDLVLRVKECVFRRRQAAACGWIRQMQDRKFLSPLMEDFFPSSCIFNSFLDLFFTTLHRSIAYQGGQQWSRNSSFILGTKPLVSLSLCKITNSIQPYMTSCNAGSPKLLNQGLRLFRLGSVRPACRSPTARGKQTANAFFIIRFPFTH